MKTPATCRAAARSEAPADALSSRGHAPGDSRASGAAPTQQAEIALAPSTTMQRAHAASPAPYSRNRRHRRRRGRWCPAPASAGVPGLRSGQGPSRRSHAAGAGAPAPAREVAPRCPCRPRLALFRRPCPRPSNRMRRASHACPPTRAAVRPRYLRLPTGARHRTRHVHRRQPAYQRIRHAGTRIHDGLTGHLQHFENLARRQRWIALEHQRGEPGHSRRRLRGPAEEGGAGADTCRPDLRSRARAGRAARPRSR